MKIFGILFAISGTFATPSDCDLPCTMDKALSGDGQSAVKMAEESSRTQTSEIVETWYRIAAENGSTEGQLAYAKILISTSRHRQDCIRANFWLERAQAAGESEAATLVGKLTAGLSDPRAFESGCKGAL